MGSLEKLNHCPFTNALKRVNLKVGDIKIIILRINSVEQLYKFIWFRLFIKDKLLKIAYLSRSW